MADDGAPRDYRNARIVGALALIALTGAAWVFDAFRSDFEVNAIFALGALGIAAGLLGVELPGRKP